MRQYTILQETIERKIPTIQKFPPKKRKSFLKNFLNENIDKIILKTKLPDPVQIRIRMMMEYFWDQRRPKGRKRGIWKINYNLWRLLYEAKSQLRHNIMRTTPFDDVFVEGVNSHQFPKNESVSTILQKISDISPANSTLRTIQEIASNFKIDSKLEEKMVANTSYHDFIICLEDTCKSQLVEALGITDFRLYEKQDIENPKWEKLVLDTKFYEGDMDKQIENWETLRMIIDNSISELKMKKIEEKEILEQLEKKFFINLVLTNV